MTTLNDVSVQFLNLMNRTDLKANAALTTTFINQAILRIQRELRVSWMENSATFTIDGTYVPSTGLTIPADNLEVIAILVGPNNEFELQRGQLSIVRDMAANWAIGHPTKFARLGNNWVLGPSPLVGDVIKVQYYQKFSALVNPTDTNALLTNGWDAVIYGALSAACDYYDDDRIDKFDKRYTQILENLQNASDGDELTADAAVGPVYPWPDDGNDFW